MRTITKSLFIIGLACLIGLTIQTSSVYALYSPTLSRKVSLIRQHVRDSQAQNGTGTVLEEVNNFIAYDRAKREAYDETGISADARIAQENIFKDISDFSISHPFDSLLMAFNFEGVSGTFISNCLRDDIWSLENLRDYVGQEMIRAYLLRDTLHGALLADDYHFLAENITLLRKYGGNPAAEIPIINAAGESTTLHSNEYFFGESPDGPNYYTNVWPSSSEIPGCPDGEFQEAFEQVANSAQVLAVFASGQGAGWDWGNIWQMAQQNARIRARQWIRANQVSLTLAGEEGSEIQSLVKGGGPDKFVGSVKTQWRILMDMLGPVTYLYDLARYVGASTVDLIGLQKECRYFESTKRVFINCSDTQIEEYRKCKSDPNAAWAEGIRCDRFKSSKQNLSISDTADAQLALYAERDETLEEMKRAFNYSITLDSVGEAVIYDMDTILLDMNMTIKRGYEMAGSSDDRGIPSLTREVEDLSNRQCSNKLR